MLTMAPPPWSRMIGATVWVIRKGPVRLTASTRCHLFIVACTDGVASEGTDGAVARARRYEAGADAIFPEALNNAEMFRAFAKAMRGVTLLANMTEFVRRRSSPPANSRRWATRW
jgi:2-methylisocitrate lyase-like PEP mutase family enzyme